MIRTRVILSATAALAMALPLAATAHADAASMSFFVTSAGPGDGANLGGLDGADAHCGKLAAAAGSAKTSWRAYFSTTEPKGEAGINARDRIGKGPWQNVNGVVIAASVAELHSETNNLTKETALTEKGETVKAQQLLIRLADTDHESEFAPLALYEAALNAERRGLLSRQAPTNNKHAAGSAGGVVVWGGVRSDIGCSNKNRAPLASPQRRPVSPANWGRGDLTGAERTANRPQRSTAPCRFSTR